MAAGNCAALSCACVVVFRFVLFLLLIMLRPVLAFVSLCCFFCVLKRCSRFLLATASGTATSHAHICPICMHTTGNSYICTHVRTGNTHAHACMTGRAVACAGAGPDYLRLHSPEDSRGATAPAAAQGARAHVDVCCRVCARASACVCVPRTGLCACVACTCVVLCP